MIKFSINSAKNYLPLKKAKGTARQRLNHAIEMNDYFSEKIQRNMKNGEITPENFVRFLKQSTGKNINIYYYPGKTAKGSVRPFVDENATFSGYDIIFPYYYEKIRASGLKNFLVTTQRLFDSILNPKFLKRLVMMINKGQNIKEKFAFFTAKINTKEALNPKELKKFISGLSKDEQIDTLQLFRYSLIKEMNADRYSKHYMRKVNNTPHTDIRYDESSINSNIYMYSEKLEIIERELATRLLKARRKK